MVTNNKKEKRKSSLFLKIFKIILLTLSCFITFLAVLPYFFKDEINNGIKDIANNYIKTEVEFKDLEISFFTHFPKLTVTLNETSIKESAPFNHKHLIEAKKIALGVDVKTLLSDQIIFNELMISDAKIHLKVDSLGHNNFDIMISSEEVKEENSSSVGLMLNDINISNSNFIYDDQKTKTLLDLKGFDYNGLIDFKDGVLVLDANSSINNTLFKFDEEIFVNQLPFRGDINTKIDLNRLRFDFIENQLKLGEFPFELKGNLELMESKSIFNLNISSEKNQLEHIPAIVPIAYQDYFKDLKLSGSSRLLFTMIGEMNAEEKLNPSIHIEVETNDAGVNYQNSKTPIQNLKLKAIMDLPALDPDQMRIKVDQLDFKLMDGMTSSSFEFNAGKQWFSQGQISSSIDLAALKNATGFKGLDTKGILNINGTWKGEFIQSKLNHLLRIPTFQVKASLNNGYFKLDEMPAALENISFDVESSNKDGKYKNTKIQVNQINAQALNNYIVGAIKVDNLSNFPINAALEAKIHLEDIYKIYPLKGMDLKGDLFASLSAKGVYDPKRKMVPVTNTKLIVKNGYLRFDDLPTLPMENIAIETHIKSGRGSFKDLSIKVLPISFTLAGKPFMINADLKDFNQLDYRVHSKGELRLGDVYKLFPIDGLDIDGLITANVGLRGNNGSALDNIQNRGFVKLENITVNTTFFPSKFKIKEGLFKFNGSTLTFEDVKARYRRNQFIFNGKISNYINYALKENQNLSGEINFQTNAVNINDFMAFNSGVTTSSSADGVVLLPKNVQLNIKGTAKQIVFNDLKLNDFTGDLVLDKGILTLKETHFGMIGSIFQMNGSYKPLNGRNAKFSFDVKGSNFDIQRAYHEIQLFREMASAAEKASGKISIDYHLEGALGADMFPRLKTVKGGGLLTVEDIQFMGFKIFNTVADRTSTNALHDANLKNVKIKTTIENNVMTISRTKFKVAGFRPRIEGQVTLDGYMNVGMRLGLPPLGIIGIPIKITGPADTFEVEVGKYEKEDLDETDEDYAEYQKSLIENNSNTIP